jgi:hypothetical protein
MMLWHFFVIDSALMTPMRTPSTATTTNYFIMIFYIWTIMFLINLFSSTRMMSEILSQYIGMMDQNQWMIQYFMDDIPEQKVWR